MAYVESDRMKNHPFYLWGIPLQLKSLKQWVGFKDGKPKNPKSPHRNAKTNDSSTWGTFEQVEDGLETGDFDAIAFVFTADCEYIGIDLDACHHPETREITPWAREIVDEIASYTEISKSGTGLHIIVRVGDFKVDWQSRVKKLDEYIGDKQAEILIARSGRSLTLTGSVFERHYSIRKCVMPVRRILERHFPADTKALKSLKPILDGRPATKQEQVLLESIYETVGKTDDRSRVDFQVCCTATRLGLSKEATQRIVSRWSKFSERNEDYFNTTWENAHAAVMQGITNAIKQADGKLQGLGVQRIIEQILLLTGGFPRRVGSTLFVVDATHGIANLRNASALIGWLQSTVGVVHWYSCASCVTKEELFQEFQRTAESYDAIQELPHEPALPNYYYAHRQVEPGDGQRLEGLIDSFEPATPTDRSLILAAFLTLLWGGTAGARPIFVITADGRGHGKTTLTDLIALLFGGCLSFSKNEDIGVIIQRLLSPTGLQSRMVLLDNLKTRNFSWAEFESLITTPTISGKQMYVGEAKRPNHLSYFITGNSLALSTDVAQRSVIIRLGKPSHSGDWFPLIRDFINEHKDELIADIVGYLRRPSHALSKYGRWGEWEHGVLAKLPNAVDAQRLILQRREECDVDADIASSVEAFVQTKLITSGYDAMKQRIRIPTEIIARWFNVATQQTESTARASAALRQMADEGQLKHLKKSQSHKHERSFIWTGDQFTGNTTVVFERQKPGLTKP